VAASAVPGSGAPVWFDSAGNPGTASNTVSISEDTKAPTASSIAASGAGITNGNGDLNAGKVVALTLNISESVTVSGTPQLILNNGGMASYTPGSGSDSLAFT
jgi:hypothetical protein